MAIFRQIALRASAIGAERAEGEMMGSQKAGQEAARALLSLVFSSGRPPKARPSSPMGSQPDDNGVLVRPRAGQ